MSQFLGGIIFLIIAGGLILHAGVELPWYIDWIGNLPGDMLIRKGGVTFYVPLSSAVVISGAFSFLVSIFSEKQK